MCTGTTNKESINTFENIPKIWYVDRSCQVILTYNNPQLQSLTGYYMYHQDRCVAKSYLGQMRILCGYCDFRLKK